MKGYRTIALSTIVVLAAVAAHAAEMFSPGLPATGSQFLECRIVNVTNVAQVVTSQGFDSTGAPASSAYTQTLASGEAGGFSIPATAGVVYCKFTVKGSTNGFRASIDVLDASVSPPAITVALPAY